MTDLFDRLSIKAGLTDPGQTAALLPQSIPFGPAPLKAETEDESPLLTPSPLPQAPAEQKPAYIAPDTAPPKANPVTIHSAADTVQTHIITPVHPPSTASVPQDRPAALPASNLQPEPHPEIALNAEPALAIAEKPRPPDKRQSQGQPLFKTMPAQHSELQPIVKLYPQPDRAPRRAAAKDRPNSLSQRPPAPPIKPDPIPVKISIGDIVVTAPGPAPAQTQTFAPDNGSMLKSYLGWRGR